VVKKIIKTGKPQLQISFNDIGFIRTTSNEHYLGEKMHREEWIQVSLHCSVVTVKQ
jgi:hypothetical protein